MSIEILLDILLSAIVLYVYHSDCAGKQSLMLEFAGVTCSPEDYDFAAIPAAGAIVDEWVLDEDPIPVPGGCANAGPVPDLLIGSIAQSVGLPTTGFPDSPTIRPTVKQYRAAAKLLGVKNASRMSKAELERQVGNAFLGASISELPIGDVTLDLNVYGFSIT